MTMVASICALPRHALGLSSLMNVGRPFSPHGDDVTSRSRAWRSTFSTTPFAGRQGDVVDSRRDDLSPRSLRAKETSAEACRRRRLLGTCPRTPRQARELRRCRPGHYGSHRLHNVHGEEFGPGARRDARGPAQ